METLYRTNSSSISLYSWCPPYKTPGHQVCALSSHAAQFSSASWCPTTEFHPASVYLETETVPQVKGSAHKTAPPEILFVIVPWNLWVTSRCWGTDQNFPEVLQWARVREVKDPRDCPHFRCQSQVQVVTCTSDPFL